MCTTEIVAFAKANKYFESKNAKLIGLSVDSNASHLAWLYDIYQKTGVKIPFPIIADRNGAIARKYGMIASDISNTETVRNVFIIDDMGKIRVILVYPMNVGRFIPEILRIIEALQTSDEENVSTPANWVPGNAVIIPPPKTYAELEKRVEETNGTSWYLNFKEENKKLQE